MTIKRYEKVPGQYSKAVVCGDMVFLAGLIAENWDGDIAEQTREVFNQIDKLLEKAGTDKSKLLNLAVYIASFDDYTVFKETYAAWIDPDNLPARATVRADLLDPRLKIEITAVAAI